MMIHARAAHEDRRSGPRIEFSSSTGSAHGVSMVASAPTQDRMEDVVSHARDTPGIFPLYTPTDKVRC